MHTKISDYVMNLPAVDAHEHLMPEAIRLALKPDVLWLFQQYAQSDLISAGMSVNDSVTILGKSPANPQDLPLDRKWKQFKPFFERIRYTGYARAVLIAIHDLYGFNTLDDRTYQAVSEKIQAENTAGITDRCLGQKGRITAILNCNYQYEQPVAYSYPIMALPGLVRQKTDEQLHELETSSGVTIKDLDSLQSACLAVLGVYRKRGVIGLKMVCSPHSPISASQARTAFCRYLSGDRACMAEEDFVAVNGYLLDQILKHVPEHRFTVAVHCGYLAGWNQDIARPHIRHMIPILRGHPEVHFDVFHLSYPWMDEAIAIGKQFANVSLNLAWCHILNPSATERAIVDLIHGIPVNKVLAMGGDYWLLPDVAYGHLKLARQILGRALSRCIESHWIDEPEARIIAEHWLASNAYEIYPLLPKAP